MEVARCADAPAPCLIPPTPRSRAQGLWPHSSSRPPSPPRSPARSSAGTVDATGRIWSAMQAAQAINARLCSSTSRISPPIQWKAAPPGIPGAKVTAYMQRTSSQALGAQARQPRRHAARKCRWSVHVAPDGDARGRPQDAWRCGIPTTTSPVARTPPRDRRSTTRTGRASSATASSRPSTAGTTTRASTSAARRSSCSSTTRPSPTRPTREARPDDVQGQGDDVLRPLDVQVRDRHGEGRGAAILVHETGPAGYPYAVVIGSWGRENFDIARRPTPTRVAWRSRAGSTRDSAKRCSRPRAGLRRAEGGRAPGTFGRSRSAPGELRRRSVTTRPDRVAGTWSPGSRARPEAEGRVRRLHRALGPSGPRPDPQGRPDLQRRGRQRLGRAGLLEIAEAFTQASPAARAVDPLPRRHRRGEGPARRRSTTPTHPLYPLAKTLADINIDVINLWGRTSDLTASASGNSTLDDLLVERAAPADGRVVRPDPEPEKGLYYRSDHFEFAKQGRAGPRSRGRGSTTSASPPTTACRSATSTRPTTTTRSATR